MDAISTLKDFLCKTHLIHCLSTAERPQTHTQEILNTDILESLPDNNGAYVYLLKDNDCKDLGESVLLIPETFGAIFKVQDNTMVSIQFEYSDEIIHTKAQFCHSLKGTIALLKTSQILNYPFRKILSLNV